MSISRRLLFGDVIGVGPPVGPDNRRWMVIDYDQERDAYRTFWMNDVDLPAGRFDRLITWSRQSIETGMWILVADR